MKAVLDKGWGEDMFLLSDIDEFKPIIDKIVEAERELGRAIRDIGLYLNDFPSGFPTQIMNELQQSVIDIIDANGRLDFILRHEIYDKDELNLKRVEY